MGMPPVVITVDSDVEFCYLTVLFAVCIFMCIRTLDKLSTSQNKRFFVKKIVRES